jgi:crotonobetainyl-CoA:carnitine CoA-transferase CaiB-like acyl-CoA transferase
MLLTDRTGAPAELPLTGRRVLDLSRFGPGPFCAALLADLGATVVAVERVRAEDARLQTTAKELTGTNLWLRDARRRADRLGLDLKARPDVLHRLAAQADVVIEGFRPGVAARLRADYATLSELQPDLVYCSISGYGQTGPYRDRPGHDINYIAEAGLLGLSGPREGPPALPGAAIADFAAGALFAASGICAALAGGRSCHIDVSMQEAVVQVMARFIVPFLEAGTVVERGSAYLTGASAWYGVHTARDGRHLAVGAVEDHFLRRLGEIAGHPDWVAARGEPDGEQRLHDELPMVLAERTRDEWVQALGDEACVSPVLSIPEVTEDPQLRHRGVFGNGALGAMARGEHHRPDADRPHRDATAILRDHGFTDHEIETLRDGGVIG